MFAEMLINFIRVTSGRTDTQLKELIPINGYESINNLVTHDEVKTGTSKFQTV